MSDCTPRWTPQINRYDQGLSNDVVNYYQLVVFHEIWPFKNGLKKYDCLIKRSKQALKRRFTADEWSLAIFHMFIKIKELISLTNTSYSWRNGCRKGPKCRIFDILTVWRPCSRNGVMHLQWWKPLIDSYDQGLSFDVWLTLTTAKLLEQWVCKLSFFKKYTILTPFRGYHSKFLTIH